MVYYIKMCELLINGLTIREWDQGVAPDEFRCGCCEKVVNAGEDYFAGFDEEQELHCVSCAATFMMHSSNEMFNFLIDLREKLPGIA